jgi:hypothetical protein
MAPPPCVLRGVGRNVFSAWKLGLALAALGLSLAACTPSSSGLVRTTTTTTIWPFVTTTTQVEPAPSLLQRALSRQFTAVYKFVFTNSFGRQFRFTEVSVHSKALIAYWTISTGSPVNTFGLWFWEHSHRHPVQCQGGAKSWKCAAPPPGETNGFSIALGQNPPYELAQAVENMEQGAGPIQVAGPDHRCVRYPDLGGPPPMVCVDPLGFVSSYQATVKSRGFIGVTSARLVFLSESVSLRDRYPSSIPPETPH